MEVSQISDTMYRLDIHYQAEPDNEMTGPLSEELVHAELDISPLQSSIRFIWLKIPYQKNDEFYTYTFYAPTWQEAIDMLH